MLSSEIDLYDLAVFCGCIIICFREGHHRSTASCLRNLDLGNPDVNNEHNQSVIFALWRMTNSGGCCRVMVL